MTPQKRVRLPKVCLKSLQGISPKLLEQLHQFGLTYLHELLALEKNRSAKKSLAMALGASGMDMDVLFFFAFSVHWKLSDLCSSLQGVCLVLIDDTDASIAQLEKPLETPPMQAAEYRAASEVPHRPEGHTGKVMPLTPPSRDRPRHSPSDGFDLKDLPKRPAWPHTMMVKV